MDVIANHRPVEMLFYLKVYAYDSHDLSFHSTIYESDLIQSFIFSSAYGLNPDPLYFKSFFPVIDLLSTCSQ